MIYFPIMVIDDIFANHEEILELAKSQTYEAPAETNYPGVASEKQLFQIDVDLAKYVCQQVFSPFWYPRDHEI